MKKVLWTVVAAIGFIPLLSGQTLSISGSITLTPVAGSSDNFTGGGSVTVNPGGAGQAKIDLSGTGDDNCNDNLELAANITLASGDKLELVILIPDATKLPSLTGSFYVKSGTGQFANKGGSGTATFQVSSPPPNVAATLLLSGNLTAPTALPPTINPSGVVPVGHTRVMIQPGAWTSVYGKNLATGTTVWDGVSSAIPTSLGGVTATINGKPAYFWFVSPNQINLQAPDESMRGCATLTLNNANGSVSTRVQINTAAPSLSLFDSKYPAAVIPTPKGGGAYGGGTYDLAGPTGRFSYPTRPVKRGETVVLYGVGFGPTNPAVPAGTAFSGAAPLVKDFNFQVLLGRGPDPKAYGQLLSPAFVGLVGPGLYQINVIVPDGALDGDNLLSVVAPNVTDARAQQSIYLYVK